MPFTNLSHEKQYTGHVFDVVKVHIQLPDGRKRFYDLVQHGDSVTILPIDEQGQIYFVRQHRIGADKPLLELPSGVLNNGEDPLTCAKRELREEIGMDAKSFQHLGGFYLAPGYADEYMMVFLAKGLFDSPLDPDADEFLNIETISVSEVYNHALAGAFEDGKTLASLLLAQPFL
jgi:ADP-ribose pyrophosphatase